MKRNIPAVLQPQLEVLLINPKYGKSIHQGHNQKIIWGLDFGRFTVNSGRNFMHFYTFITGMYVFGEV